MKKLILMCAFSLSLGLGQAQALTCTLMMRSPNQTDSAVFDRVLFKDLLVLEKGMPSNLILLLPDFSGFYVKVNYQKLKENPSLYGFNEDGSNSSSAILLEIIRESDGLVSVGTKVITNPVPEDARLDDRSIFVGGKLTFSKFNSGFSMNCVEKNG